jgi:dihydrofolate reductase
MRDPGDNPVAMALKTQPVRGIDHDHAHRPAVSKTTVLSGEVAAAIAELKAKPGRELQAHGSCKLIRWLLDNHLLDEINLLICPVVVGQGTRLFPTAARTRRSNCSSRGPRPPWTPATCALRCASSLPAA